MSLSLLAKLSLVSRLDGILAQINAERAKLNTQLKEKEIQLIALQADLDARTRTLSERTSKQSRQERDLNEERQKLMDRRKALATFSGQKVQQAAEREISAASDALGAQEESLIQGLSEIENLERVLTAAKSEFEAVKTSAQSFRVELDATLVTLEQRQKEKESMRAELLGGIDAASVATYNRTKDRFPQNAVVPLADKSCSGCFQTLVAQTVMQVQRSDKIIKCPGCGRILCLESHVAEGKL
ncbi:MAG: hypothetical protein EBZ48_07905 [Proteobacteria bacterium]|nr:hypothetical protein [Pseudomonadota bacterium]